MDEAERCHEITYIAYGVLLAHGSVEDVIRNSRLVTYTVSGPDADKLAPEFSSAPGVDMVAPFGTSLHISGHDEALLEDLKARYAARKDLIWARAEPTLEDVFIALMGKAKDNFQ